MERKTQCRWFNNAYRWAVGAHRLASEFGCIFVLRGLGKSHEEKETKI
jgi:hypothetical protein